MPWFFVALFAGALVASLLIAPKLKTENATASTLDDLNFPRAQEAAPIPLGLGRFRARGPNTMWVGDWEAVPIKKKVKTGLFSSKKVIVGYRYFVGLALGICLGPGCKLLKIWYGKELLWEGVASADGTAININKPDLFGGPEKGGGFVGTIRFYTGSFTQTPNPYLESVIGAGDVCGHRGIAYVVFEKCEIGERNSLQDLSFEMSRYTNGLQLAGGMEQVGDDLNPFELLYQLYAPQWGGLNVPLSMINTDKFVEVAETVYAEGNGMSLFVSSSKDGSDLSDIVLRQVDGLVYEDPQTGQIVPRLIREDYDIEDLPVFDESNILAVRNFTSKLWEDTYNQVRVKYTNRDKKYEDGSAFEQDLANIGAQERVRSFTATYPGVHTGALAQIIAKRDLSQASVPTFSAKLELDRTGQGLRPGDVFVWGWPEYNIAQTVMRVKNFDLGALNNGRIVVEVNQDEFAVKQTLFAEPGAGGSNPVVPNDPAVASPDRFVIESPYFFVNASGLALGNSKSAILVGAEAPTGSNEYDIYTSIDTVEYNASEEGVVYTPIGALKTAITATADLNDGVIASLTIEVEADDLEAYTATQVANGYGMFFVGGELFAHEGFVDNGNGTVTLSNVWRALLDTMPEAHAIDDAVYFIFGDNVVDDQFDYTATVRVKVLPKTLRDALDLGAAPYDAIALKKRAARPLCPVAVRFDGGSPFAPPAAGTGSHTVAWANRDRQSLTVRKIADTTSENEAGQQTIFRYRLNGGAWVAATLAPGVKTYTFDAGAGGGDTVEYEIYSTRDGLDSFGRWQFTAGAAAGTGTTPDNGGASPPDTSDPYEPSSVTLWKVNEVGTGASQDILIPHANVNEIGVLVFVNGIRYQTDEYSIVGTDLTLTTNAPGDTIEIVGIVK